MAIWMSHERYFLVAPYADKIRHDTYAIKMWFIAVAALTLTLIDHFAYLITAIENTLVKIGECDADRRDFWRILFVNERQVFFQVLPYHFTLLPFLEWYEIIKQICWVFSEVFIVCLSLAIAKRFQQLTNRLKFYEKHHLAESFWNEIREHYNIICNLVLKADKILSPLVLVYSFSNLFFICQKIFMQFESRKLKWDRYYSFFSAIFLILRFMTMLFLGAEVNDKSREVLQILREVPNETFDGVNVSIIKGNEFFEA